MWIIIPVNYERKYTNRIPYTAIFKYIIFSVHYGAYHCAVVSEGDARFYVFGMNEYCLFS